MSLAFRLTRRLSRVLCTALAAAGLLPLPALAQVSLTTLGATYTQNFDTLPSSGSATWTNNATIAGWYHARTGTGTTLVANDGASNSGNLYSYGTVAATDRALGSLGSANAAAGSMFWGVRLQNNTGSTITSLNVALTGEQWRNSAAAAQTIAFSYLVGSPAVTGSLAEFQTPGVAVSNLDFTGPITGGTAAALNGNLPANRVALTFNITGLNIPNGTEVMLRWSDPDQTGSDHGLAIDDFSVTPNSGAALPALAINDVVQNEGNSGTTAFTFTVSLAAPAGPGGVSFDIATADGSASAPGDYIAQALTGQTIPEGSSSYTFTVLVNGNTIPALDRTFFVNVSNVTGATLADGQGQGTIVNDEPAPTLTINDVSMNEGSSGTTTFTFTVSLSEPAPAGGVTFDIATADGSATAGSDYTAKTLLAQTIAAGNSSYTFDVSVNGDVLAEPDETFFVNISNPVNVIVIDGQGRGTIVNDDLYKIHDVQGSGAATPLATATVYVEGVVVASFQGAGQLQGFFLQEEDADADADPATSEGIFVYCGACSTTVVEGQRVKVKGVASERFNMTQISATAAGSVVVTEAGNHLAEVTPAVINLPIAGDIDAFYEAREGMLVTYPNTLTVSEHFELARFGQIVLFSGGRPFQFTETDTPDTAGYAAHLDTIARRRVILDDDNNTQNAYLSQPNGSQAVFYPQANGGFSAGTQGSDFFRGGDLVNGLTGVLHWSYPGFGADTWRIRPTSAHPVTFTVANPRPAAPPAVGGAIKAASMNLLNYFTTIDTGASTSSGPCSPGINQDCRGADSVAELDRQRERASIVVCSLNADIYGFMELENTTASDTITDLLGAVNTRCGGANPYQFVNTGGTLGTDAIRVQLAYRTGIVAPVGAPLTDMDGIHSRPPTAQTFDVVHAVNPAFGERFTVIANHFKSKGCSDAIGADADANDGQGCYASRRTQQATRLLAWVSNTVIPAAGDPDVLLLGDFNAYAKETPVATLTGAGFVDVETALLGASAYSYLFNSELGHLDYAFASPSLFAKVAGVGAWHINADEVALFDYNDEIKDTGESSFDEKPDGSTLTPPRVVFQPATPYRASDHDPVLIGLFTAADLAIAKVATPQPVVAGNNLSYAITVTNNGPDAATSASWSSTLAVGTTFSALPAVAGWSCSTPAIGAGGTVSCTTSSMNVGNAAFSLMVGVDAGLSGGTLLTNSSTVSAATPDMTASNNSATASVTVISAVAPGFTGSTATGSGVASFSISGGGPGCTLAAQGNGANQSAYFIPVSGHPKSPSTAPPAGTAFPHGLLDFVLIGCVPGSTVNFTVVYPQALPAAAQYWKFGPTPGNKVPHWYVLPAAISGNVASFSITDGGLGDDDLLPNGSIVDQGGPALVTVLPVPTLNEWMVILLALGLAMAGIGTMRKNVA